MESLSNLLKKSDVFQNEFDKIFPAQTFNKTNILRYVSVCTAIVLEESRKRYPEHIIKFVNPVFVVDKEIYPAPDLHGDTTVLQLTRPLFNLLQSKIIVPFSVPILDNLLSGLCLFFGETAGRYPYQLFKTCDLDNLVADTGMNPEQAQRARVIDDLIDLDIDVTRFSNTLNKFCEDLLAISEYDKIRLVKTLILYRDMANGLSDALVYSFVNKYNQTRSFFDCLLTFVSAQPFDEDELLDLALITEGMSLPIANYDHSKSKGISAHTMAKRNSLRTAIIESFKHV
jgi:hypothetical protein